MAELPTLERIVEDFIDDVAHRIEDADSGIGDVYGAYGLRALFHNMYVRIDDDRRCALFANEMAKWTQEYTRGLRSVIPSKSGSVKYVLPISFITMGSCTAMNAGAFIFTGAPYAGLAGLALSSVLLWVGIRALRQAKQGGNGGDVVKAFGIRPYEKYADDIRDAPVEAVREALLATKEYAYVTLDLAPSIPSS